MPMLGSVLFGEDQAVAQFVVDRVGLLRVDQLGPYTALGVVRKQALAAGFIFHEQRSDENGKPYDIRVTIASDNPSWAFPSTLRVLFSYPFLQLGVVRMTTIVARKNKKARRLNVGVGWILEGVLKRGYLGRDDACIYRMLRSECRFLKKELSDG